MPNPTDHTTDPSIDLTPDHTSDVVADASEGEQRQSARRPGPAAVVGLAALGTVSSLAVAGVAFADRGGDWGYRGGGRHWWGVGGMLLLLALVAATAALAMLLVNRRVPTAASAVGGAPVPPPVSPTPGPLAGAEAILAERLARGEIGPDDYRASVAALRGQPVDMPVEQPGAPGTTDGSTPS